jgi:serine/tyrosine/threonine adenylyltransferase
MTPYSRGADGRAVLRSSVREFLCSEAMHHLGIPTTRALSLVLTNDTVMRDMLYDGNPALEPGAIVCRVAPSFLRFGSLELPNARGDRALVEQTIDYVIDQHYHTIESRGTEGAYRLLEAIASKTAGLIVDWMRVGFVHGVLNTDNMSLHGLTIDYGPYGWLEEFDLNWTPNTTDAQGRRYAYGRQPDIGLWNITRLGESMYGVLDDVERLKAAVGIYKTTFESKYPLMLRSKLGLGDHVDVVDEQLVGMIGQVLTDGRFDMTNFYQQLGSWMCREGTSESAHILKHFETASYASNLNADAAALLTYWVRLYDERHVRCGRLDVQRRTEMD